MVELVGYMPWLTGSISWLGGYSMVNHSWKVRQMLRFQGLAGFPKGHSAGGCAWGVLSNARVLDGLTTCNLMLPKNPHNSGTATEAYLLSMRTL